MNNGDKTVETVRGNQTIGFWSANGSEFAGWEGHGAFQGLEGEATDYRR